MQHTSRSFHGWKEYLTQFSLLYLLLLTSLVFVAVELNGLTVM